MSRYADVPHPCADVIGGLVNARGGVIGAIVEGRIDVGPLDGFVHDLIRHTEPAYAAQVRIVETTEPTPMPAIVATAALDASTLARLRDALTAAVQAPELAEHRATLLLADVAFPSSPALYVPLRDRAEAVDAAAPW